ncbi:MAG TPA: hypothetical protein VJU61_03190 [Polyangiaceae bacterium]|nr:hypothetical protein [Polyangiaceae bacterium]
MQHCSWPGFFSLSLVLAAVACGGDDPAPADAEAASDAPSTMQQPDVRGEGNLFGVTLESSNQLLAGLARVEVVELDPTVKFKLTATYPGNANDLLLLQVALPGVESVAGPHTFDFGRPYVAPAFAIVSLDGTSYSSREGTFELTLDADGGLDGSFEVSFSEDLSLEDHPLADRSESLNPAEAMRLSGSFEGSWSLLCKSPVPALPGDHSVTDSEYCKTLEF